MHRNLTQDALTTNSASDSTSSTGVKFDYPMLNPIDAWAGKDHESRLGRIDFWNDSHGNAISFRKIHFTFLVIGMMRSQLFVWLTTLLLVVLPLELLAQQSKVNKNEKLSNYDSSVPEPTLKSVPYGSHPRQVIDLWLAKSEIPTPLVFVIHGGGWSGGEKERVHRFVDVRKLIDAGISVAAINYRLMRHAQEQKVIPPVKAPLEDVARALQLVRHRSDEWGIDSDRIGAAGGSAGACSSLWLAFHNDLRDPLSTDPVARQSTRLDCAAVNGAQTTLDPAQMKKWTPNSRYGGHAFGIGSFTEFLKQRGRLLPWIREYSPYHLATADDPNVFLYYSAGPSLGKPQKDPTHTSNFGVKLKEHLDLLGVPCTLIYPGNENGIANNATDYLISRLNR